MIHRKKLVKFLFYTQFKHVEVKNIIYNKNNSYKFQSNNVLTKTNKFLINMINKKNRNELCYLIGTKWSRPGKHLKNHSI